MDAPILINGQAYDWGSVTATIAGVPISGVDAISYSETQNKTNNYGVGNRPVSRGAGRIEVEASITLHMEEIERLTNAAPNRNLLKVGAFDITVTFANDGQIPVTHVIKNCEFASNSRSLEGDQTLISEELTLVASHVQW